MSPTTHTLFQCCLREEISHFQPGGGGGGRNLTISLTGRLRSEVHPVTLIVYYLSQKRSPFRVPSIDK